MKLTPAIFVSTIFIGHASAFAGQSPSNWTAHVSRVLGQQEYFFAPVREDPARPSGAWSAPNRAQGLRGRVTTRGIEVIPRVADGDDACAQWTLSIATARFGRGGRESGLCGPTMCARDDRVDLDHGVLHEWFVNDRRGIEQGWTIANAPAGAGPLWLALEFGGELCARIDPGARSLTFVDASGQAELRYSGLMAFDADGRELDARFSPSSPTAHDLTIQVDDAGALYPLTIDPVLSGPAWSAESDQDGALFGVSVAAAGDVNGDGYSDVIVGASSYDGGEADEGRVFVYWGSSTGLSTSADWTAEIDQAGAAFGGSVATAGDVNGDGYSDVIIGAGTFDDGETDEGGAFVYFGSATGLSTSAAWTVESGQVGALFGSCVATAGDTNGDGFSDVIVGAPAYDDGEIDEGRASVYAGSSLGLATSPAWTAESDQVGALYGSSVATAGDVDGDGFDDVIVGAPRYSNGELEEGRAFVYRGSSGGPSGSADWTAESDQASAWFGESVAAAGDVDGDGFGDVIVGAPQFDDDDVDEGRSFVYLGSSTGLSASADWTADGNVAGALFGAAVATAGDVNGDAYSDVVIGAPEYTNGESGEGQAFVFLGAGAGLATSPSWTAESDQTLAHLGASVSLAGDVDGDGYGDVIVGAAEYDDGETDEGRAFVFHGAGDGLDASVAWSAESNQANAFLGYAVATAGDVNGDGYSDVIVGAYAYSNDETREGRTFAYLGSATGLSTSPAWTAESNQANSQFGAAVTALGDLNGDGFGDVLVGAPAFDNGETNEGRVFLYFGTSVGLRADPIWTADGNQAVSQFGFAVAAAGDVNADGLNDFLVSSYTYDDGESDEGRVSLYLGHTSKLSTTPAWTAASNQADAWFGYSVASAGDVNGDGYGDVIVGAIQFDDGETNEGRAYVYTGCRTGLSTTPAWTAESDQANAQFGYSVATAGDVNGDGYSDVIIGANQYDNGQTDEGRVFVYYGSASGLSATPDWTAESNQANAQFGRSVATAGDVNNDGYSDVIVGSSLYDSGQTDEGRAFGYLGSASGLANSPSWIVESNQGGALLGWSVSTAGDVNGDGYSDVIVGGWGYGAGQNNEGQARVFLGNDGRGGWTRAAEQRKPDDAAAIGLFNGWDERDEIRLKLGFERTLAGFRWSSGIAPTAQLQWELEPLRVALDGSHVHSGTVQPITGTPLDFSELAALVHGTSIATAFGFVQPIASDAFHWRVRVRTNNPMLPVTPWVSMPWNNDTESKLHTRPLPAVHSAR